MTIQADITSKFLDAPRKVWVEPAITGPADDCLIFLDGELYANRVKAPEIIRDAQAAGILPPVTSVYVSSLDAAARHADFTCNENFSMFVATDLCHWIKRTVNQFDRLFLCGLSLSALSAAFTTLKHQTTFSGTLCQSPSAWWNDEWLASSLTQGEKNTSRFWISVGNQELEEQVTHPPSGLFQKTNQLDSVRRLAQKLTAVGQDVHYAEFSGGHDSACWAEELPPALLWLLNNQDRISGMRSR
ncbi:MAG: alpha/beta hydrolase-fold protein [Planctomycetota bacterium]